MGQDYRLNFTKPTNKKPTVWGSNKDFKISVWNKYFHITQKILLFWYFYEHYFVKFCVLENVPTEIKCLGF